MAEASVKDVRDFFEMTMPEMKREWMGVGEDPSKKLTDEDKKQLKEGIGNGTLTY